MFGKCSILFIMSLSVYTKGIESSFSNNSAILISRYSKVAHWGQARTTTTEEIPTNEGRSNSGQTLWTHRSDVNIVGGQNLKPHKNNGLIYHYVVPKKQSSSKLGTNRNEKYPAVGEVQERFNPKPYFNYDPIPPKQSTYQSNNKRPTDTLRLPSPVYSKPPTSKDTPPDSYNSPFDSYNPPAIDTDDSKNDDPVYPPIDQPSQDNGPTSQPAPVGYSYTKPSEDNDDDNSGYDYTPAKKPSPSSDSKRPPKQYATSGPPLAPTDEMSDNHGNDFYQPSAPNGHDELILDHPPPGYEDDRHQMPPDMGHTMNNGNGDMAQDDLSPPPSDSDNKFPQYLYNGGGNQGNDNGHSYGTYDFDHHHTYEEVEPHTPPPEDKRVNKGHYSYYYLGRKLWYIPLYFSVYFIIYVTVLILKSIARHKIHLKHDLHDKFRESRKLDLDEKLDDVHKSVTTAIYSMNKTYIM